MHITHNEIHLWLVDLQLVSEAMVDGCRQLMDDSELQRNQRYRFAQGRFADCVTRGLARAVLSRYSTVAASAWSFSKGEHGKPEIDAPRQDLPLRFNLSHSKRYVVCAVALDFDLGVDIECIERKNNILDIADHYFSNSEVEDLFALPEARRGDRFFDYWTLKEAYMKASGEGISLGLANFSFHWADTERIEISFSSQLDDNPDDWLFWLMSPANDHRLAVALRAAGSRHIKLRLFDTEPLAQTFHERQIAALS